MCEPIRKEAISRTKLFIATVRARILRAEAGYSRVKARKTGLPPRGFTTGNRALRISRVLLATSNKGLLQKGEYSLKRRYGSFLVEIEGPPPRVFCKCCI
jgi:hypothetical protein